MSRWGALGALVVVAIAASAANGHAAKKKKCPAASDRNAIVAQYVPPVRLSCSAKVAAGAVLHPTETVSSVDSQSGSGMLEFKTSQLPDCRQLAGASDKIAPAPGVALTHLAGITLCKLLNGDTNNPVKLGNLAVAALTDTVVVRLSVGADKSLSVGIDQGQAIIGFGGLVGVKVVSGGQQIIVPISGERTISDWTPTAPEATVMSALENNVLQAGGSQVVQSLLRARQTSVVLVGSDPAAVAKQAQLLTSAGIHVTTAPASATTDAQSLVPSVTSTGSAAPAVVVVGGLQDARSYFQSLNALRTRPSLNEASVLPTRTAVFWVAPAG